MNKSFRYTVLTILLALVFMFGGMAGMNVILEVRENRMLSESGSVVVQAPVRAWQKQDDREEEENSGGAELREAAPTMQQMEEAISCWNNRMNVMVHNPVNGQISMEEAVKAGEEWLAEMELLVKVRTVYSVNAVLGVAGQSEAEEVQLEPYYSFWTVKFSDEGMYAVLYINAVTGKVVGAEVSLSRNLPDTYPAEKLGQVVELAGLQESGVELVVDADEASAVIEVADSQLYAQMEVQSSQNRQYELVQYGQGSVGVDPEEYDREYSVVTYKLAVAGE